MLVGDAAHQINPMTGGGIASGMRGGKIAGQIASSALEKGDFSKQFLMKYPKTKPSIKQPKKFDINVEYGKLFSDIISILLTRNLNTLPKPPPTKTAIISLSIYKFFFRYMHL